MRNLPLALVFLAVSPLFAASRPVTVNQLEEALVASHGKSDTRLARQLSGLMLTERLSAARLARWQEKMPGPESRRALVVLADLSSFLSLPPAEIPAVSPPDLPAQRELMASVVTYAEKTIHQLPDFMATRDTIHFEDSPPAVTSTNRDLVGTTQLNGPLHPVSRSTATVLYRDGHEIVEPKAAKTTTSDERTYGLTTSGEFGPILATVLVDAAHGKLAWSHWERGAGGPRAVFQFEVPKQESHYHVEFCCSSEGVGASGFQQYSGYRGDIAVDPIDGSILRLTMRADLKPDDKIARADILVEYSPVEIGGRAYICPVRSVSVAAGPVSAGPGSYIQTRSFGPAELTPVQHPLLQTSLNDVSFTSYHVFRSESRVLTAAEAAALRENPASESPTPGTAQASAPATENPVPARADNPQPPSTTIAAAPAPVRPEQPEETSPAKAASAAPEISEVSTTAAPDIPAAETPEKTLLRVTTRLVDVGVVALDRKGRPVTGLKPEDFEVYDNGQKQVVHSFIPSGPSPAAALASTPGQPGSSPDQLVYSNQRAEDAGGPATSAEKEDSITIILIDANNLAFADLAYVRGQVVRFLDRLSASERVGVYVQNARGFQVLVEETANHAAVADRMRAWMPKAQQMARAQEEEARNRQQFDEVVHLDDLAYVNGNQNLNGQPEVMVDPQLRDFGSDPAHGAMLSLVSVARHLAPVPGHKNLVWIASDNVLADWADKAVGIEKGGKHNDAFILRAQEVLNDAHVSVYPLDASQLEATTTDPSLANSAVEVSPSVPVPPGALPQGGAAGPGLGRQAAGMQQDLHPIQASIQELAAATGGRVFRRGGDLAGHLNSVVDEGSATYLLGFTPSTPADDKYHSLSVKLATRRNVLLRYRTGYQYSKEPATMKDRFRQAVWQPDDLHEIALSARSLPAYSGTAFRLEIAARDLELNRQGDRWIDKLDIFIVRRSPDGFVARITGRTLALALQQATYENLKDKGIPFDQFVEKNNDTASLRILVADQNSGRMGSITIPASALNPAN